MHLRPDMRILSLFTLTFISCVMLVALASGCGASARQKAVTGSLVTLNAARDGFMVWDGQHQLELVKAATSREAAEKAVGEYLAKREKVVAAFKVAYEAVKVAATQTDKISLSAATAAIQKLLASVQQIRGP